VADVALTESAQVEPRPGEAELDWPSRMVDFIARHWLFILNTLMGVFAGLPILAPVLMARGWILPARFIYWLYQFTCHQLPYRSFFLGGPQFAYTPEEITRLTGRSGLLDLFHRPITLPGIGYQMAWCERDFAIYTSIFLAGLLFALVRHRLQPLPLWVYLIIIAPMGIDGLTQLLGWRESTWELRVLTGALFGAGTVWLAYPYVERGMQEIRATLKPRL